MFTCIYSDTIWVQIKLQKNWSRMKKMNWFMNTLPESLISVFPAWAYCQLWLSSTAIVNQNQWLSLSRSMEIQHRRATVRNPTKASHPHHCRMARRQLDNSRAIHRPTPRYPLSRTKPKALPAFCLHQLASFPPLHVTNPSPQQDLVTSAALH